MIDSSIPAVLRTRAQNQPNEVAFNFIDYDVDPMGFEERLTWSELYQRVQVVAHELLQTGSVGDRVAILAPQGFDYIVGLLGALEAGLTAVPLPVPMLGLHDERVSGVLKDCALSRAAGPLGVLATLSAGVAATYVAHGGTVRVAPRVAPWVVAAVAAAGVLLILRVGARLPSQRLGLILGVVVLLLWQVIA